MHWFHSPGHIQLQYRNLLQFANPKTVYLCIQYRIVYSMAMTKQLNGR